MKSDTGKILDALEFAAEKHRFQRRKDSGQTPYIQHPVQVAKLVFEHTNGEIKPLLAALLHDTIEDTDTSKEEIETKFGKEILEIILELTDNKNQPKLFRKVLQIKNASKKSDHAKTISIADKICNIRDLINKPPVEWSTERKLMYLDWAEQVCRRMSGINKSLDSLFISTLKSARDILKKD